MSVTSIEELEALSPGEEVIVKHAGLGDQRWARSENGFSRNGTEVKSANFVGLVAANQVIRSGQESGAMFGIGATNRYVLLRVQDDMLDMAWFRGDRFEGLQRHPRHVVDTQMQAVADIPAWRDVAVTMGLALLNAREGLDAAQTSVQEHAVTLARTRVLTDEMVNELHEIAASIAEGTSVNDGDLDETLARWGIPRMVDHISDVRVSGTVDYQPDAVTIADALDGGNGDVELGNVPTLRVPWSMDVSVTRTGAGCTCGDVTRDEVYIQLPRNLRDGTWDFGVECG